MTSNAPRNRSLRLLTAASGLLVWQWCSVAWAEPLPLSEALTGEAKADYDAARVLYTDGDFSGAALKFAQAYKKSKDARLLWNQAAARKGERRYADVERLVKQYLQEAPELSAADKAKAEDLLRTIAAFIADVTITVNEPGASIVIDGVERGVSPLSEALRLDLGKHAIQITKAGFEPFVDSQEVTNDTTLAINLLASVHQGRLRILSPGNAEVYVDGKRVTSGSWEGTVVSGVHKVEVRSVSRKSFRTDAQVRDDETTTLQVTGQDLGETPPAVEQGGSSTWLWVTAGVLLLGGAAAGGYFLLKPDPLSPPAPDQGSVETIELPLRF